MSEHNQLEVRMAAQEQNTENLIRHVEKLGQTVEMIADRVSRGTNWGVLGTWLGIAVTILGGLGYMALAPVGEQTKFNYHMIDQNRAAFVEHISDGHPERIQQQVTRNAADMEFMREQFNEHRRTEGHPAMISRVRALEKQIDRLERLRDEENLRESK